MSLIYLGLFADFRKGHFMVQARFIAEIKVDIYHENRRLIYFFHPPSLEHKNPYFIKY
jgi:hypothetical protein